MSHEHNDLATTRHTERESSRRTIDVVVIDSHAFDLQDALAKLVSDTTHPLFIGFRSLKTVPFHF